jgi:tetratricopeptide (TPR) repeat protein
MDFGVARRILPSDWQEAETLSFEQKLTGPGVIVGTVSYMSPEQLCGRETDHRSDLFSLGILLFEAVTGHHPFEAKTAAETSAAILHKPPGTLADRRLVKQLGPLGRILGALLEKEPSDRPKDAAETARLLSEASRDLGGASSWWKRPSTAVAATTALVGVTALLGYLAWKAPTRSPSPVAPIARPALAVLPFEFRSNPDDQSGRGAMIADLLATTVGESAQMRSVPPDRVAEVLSTYTGPPNRPAAIDQVSTALSPQWLVTGTLYEEADELLATIRIYKGSSRAEAGSFQVKALRSSDLVQKAASRLIETTGAPRVPGFAPARPVPRFAAVEEAQLLEHDARRLASRSSYGQAISKLERAIDLDPGFIDAYVLQADLFDQVGNEARSREAIQKASRLISEQGLQSDSRQALQASAIQGRLLGLPAGLESLQRLAQLYPDEPDTQLALAGALLRAGKAEEALRAADQAAALNPEDPRPQLMRARILLSQEKLDEARIPLDRAEKQYRQLGNGVGLAEALESQASLLFLERRFPEAEEVYRRAGEQFRKMDLPIRALGDEQSVADMHLMLWKLDEAEAGYRKALAGLKEAGWYSQTIDSLAGLGGLLMRRGKMKEAEAILKEADDEAHKLGNEQFRLVPLINMANLYCYSGRPREARQRAEEAIEIARVVNDNSTISSARGLIALSALLEGRFDEAIPEFRALADEEAQGGSKSRQGYLLGQLAEALELAEQPAAALDSVNQAIQLLEPLGPGIRLAYRYGCRARILASLGRLEEAAEDLKRVESMTVQERALPQVRDMLQATRATLDLARGNLADVLKDVSAAEPAGQRATLSRGTAEILRAEAQLLSGEASQAAEAARRVKEGPGASAVERAAAGVLRAQALSQMGQAPAALKEARAAYAAARQMELPLTQARAAALIVRLDPKGSDTARIAQAGRAQMQHYLDAIPPDARDAVRARVEIREALESLKL